MVADKGKCLRKGTWSLCKIVVKAVVTVVNIVIINIIVNSIVVMIIIFSMIISAAIFLGWGCIRSATNIITYKVIYNQVVNIATITYK